MAPRKVAFFVPSLHPQVFKFGQREKIYKELWTVPLIPKGTYFFAEKDSLKILIQQTYL
jgi:hypothetical protein